MRNQLCTLALIGLSTLAHAQDDDAPSMTQANALLQTDMAAAAAAFGKIAEAEPENARAQFYHGYTLHMSGQLERAHDAHLNASRFPQYAALSHYNHACVHALRGERDEAFKALAFAREVGFSNANQLRTDGDMDNLREDPRFARILSELEGGSTVIATSAPEPTVPSTIDVATLPPERRLDFRIGEWTVRQEGSPDRTQIVKSIFDGNGLESRGFLDGEPTPAISNFVFSEEDGTWTQVWVNGEGHYVVLKSGIDEGQLFMQQESFDGAQDRSARALFRDVTADSFTLDWQVTGGDTWETQVSIEFERNPAGDQ